LTFPSESTCTKQEISSTRPWRFFITWRLQWLRVSSVHCSLHPVTEPRVHILPPRPISCLRGWHDRYNPPHPTSAAFRLPADLLCQSRTMDCTIAIIVSKSIAIILNQAARRIQSPSQLEPV
jgi:hypothetical protein